MTENQENQENQDFANVSELLFQELYEDVMSVSIQT
jgi:hypothetical protein